MAAVLVLEPIFEADLQPEQYAYRRDRSALDAVRHVHKLVNTGNGEIVDADLNMKSEWERVPFNMAPPAGNGNGPRPGHDRIHPRTRFCLWHRDISGGC